MHLWMPEFAGQVNAEAVPDDFAARLAQRVRSGLFIPGKRLRADYTVRSLAPRRLVFQAASFSTAIAIGLNEVEVEASRSAISYRVRYWRWTLYCVALCGVVGATLTVAALLGALDPYLTRPHGAALFWGQVALWGVAWPWILTAAHKRFAARSLEAVLREVLAAAPRG